MVEGLGLRLKVRVRVRGGVKVVGCYLVAEGLELGVGLGVIAGRHQVDDAQEDGEVSEERVHQNKDARVVPRQGWG